MGSYIARIQRIFDIRFRHYPPPWTTWVVAAAIYVNFFAHHWLPDIRLGLFAATALLFGRGWFYFTPDRRRRSMPFLLGFFLVAVFIWLAENVGTYARAWVYPGQDDGWEPVSLAKLGSWFLLMMISVVLVSLVHRPEEEGDNDFRHPPANAARPGDPAARESEKLLRILRPKHRACTGRLRHRWVPRSAPRRRGLPEDDDRLEDGETPESP